MRSRSSLLLLGVALAGATAPAPKISHATVLIPTDSRGVFVLSALNGCFHFTTDRPDIIHLSPVSDPSGCTTQARVSMNPSFSDLGPQGFGKALVLASETTSKFELRSEILVSAITRLEVITRVRRLAIGELEAIQVQGYDRFGNTFSSLEGLEFEWTLDEKKLKIVKSDQYDLSLERLRLEQSGKQSDMLIVEGYRAGKTSVSVSNSGVKSNTVTMSVVEPFKIDPSMISFPVCGSTNLGIRSFLTGPVELPNKSFSFSVPSSVRQNLVVDSSGKVKSLTKSPLITSVTVTDKRTDDNEESARICVGIPESLTYITDTLYPVVGETARIEFVATSKDCGYLSLDSPDVDIEVRGAVTGRSIIELPALVPGSELPVTATLKSVGRDCVWNSTSLSTALVLKTCKPISLNSGSEITIPETQSEIRLNVSGGSGSYTHPGLIAGSSIVVVTDFDSPAIVSDENNGKNSASVTVKRVRIDSIKLSIPTELNVFVGYDKPFDEIITGMSEDDLLFNCSSLIESVRADNTSLVTVEVVSAIEFSCGTIRISPIMPGETKIVVSTLTGNFTIPVTIHSPFVIAPDSGVVIAVNSSYAFSVTGGSLKHLRLEQDEDVVSLSHPWVADVVSDRDSNSFRIVCRTTGLGIKAHVSHTSSGGIEFDCVEIEKIFVLADRRSEISKDESVFVTCGHTENHTLEIVAIDPFGRKVDNFTSIENHRLEIPPMDCDTDLELETTVTLPGNRVLTTKTVLKARNMVRPTIGPLLAKEPLYLPCEFVSDIVSHFAIPFTGGSGSYSLETSSPDIDGGNDDFSSSPSVVVIGELGMYAVKLPATKCGAEYQFAVRDATGASQLIVRTIRIDQVKMRLNRIEKKKEPVSVVMEHEWTDVSIRIKFETGVAIDSIKDGKWFGVVNPVFGWGIPEAVESRNSNGKIAIKLAPTESPIEVNLVARLVKLRSSVSVSVVVINRPRILPTLPSGVSEWILAPSSIQHVSVENLNDLPTMIRYRFLSQGPVTTQPIHPVGVAVTAESAPTYSPANITLVIETMKTNRIVYSANQAIVVKNPVGVKINSGIPITVTKDSRVSLFVNFVDNDHVAYFPPHQLEHCQVKWSLYGALMAQSIHYQFTQLGSVPVQVKVFCDNMTSMDAHITVHVVPDVRIKPIANLVTGASYAGLGWPGRAGPSTPVEEGSERVELSESEVGVVTYRHAVAAVSSSTPIHLTISKQSVIGQVTLMDSHGVSLVFPDDLSLTVGASRPEVVSLSVVGDSIRAKGLSEGCSSVFVYFRTAELVMLQHGVCVQAPVHPKGPLVLSGSTGAHVRFIGGSDVTRLRVAREHLPDIVNKTHLISSMDLSRKIWVDFSIADCDNIDSISSAVEFVHPLSGEWELTPPSIGVIQRPMRDGEAIVDFTTSRSVVHGVLSMGRDLFVSVSVEPIGRLEWSSTRDRLVHKQDLRQEIYFRPVSVSGSDFSPESALLEQRFNHVCQIDRDDVFAVTSGPMSCLLTPIIVGANRAPLSIVLSVIMGSFSESREIFVENHFHLVTGPYMVPISVERVVTVEETVTLQLTNPTDSIDECEISVPSNIVSSAINMTGHFEISRVSPKGSSDVSVGVQCGLQSIDFVIAFLETPKIIQDTFTPIYDSVHRSNTLLLALSWVVKIVASIFAIVGVGMLFRKKIVKPVRRELHARYSAPAQFAPHPHPDKDIFITERPNRKTTSWRE